MVVASGGPRPEPGTVTAMFFGALDRFDKPDALQFKVGARYEGISHRALAQRVRNATRGLLQLGVQQGDRVAIMSENRPEWVIADLACLTGRITDVAVYPVLPPNQVEYILRDSGCVAIFVSTSEQAAKVAEIRSRVPSLKTVISFDELRAHVDLTLAELERRGADGAPPDYAARHRADALQAKPTDVATLLYTSGTTGEPKGVMLTHDNIHSNVISVRDVLSIREDTCLSFLPLSHIFERTVGYYFMLDSGVSIAYAESIDTIAANLLEVRPTLVIAVPRVYEKIHARVLESAASGGAVKRAIFSWARSVGEAWADARLLGRPIGSALAMKYRVADRLVFAKLRARTGGNVRYFVSGSAPLATEINKFFYAAGLTILEGYGLTETSPIVTANMPDAVRLGTVGMPVTGVSVAIAEDGEILVRGPNVMAGYFNKPQATADAVDADGWFRTGDIGVLTDGFLSITDRKKELIVTAGGKNIAPQPIENRIRSNKFVAQAVVIGDRRKFPMVLVVPEFGQLEKWAHDKGLTWTDRASLITLPQVRAMMQDEVLGPLSDLAHFEQPKKVALLPNDFTIEAGELTPTMKVKRRAVDDHYRDVIDRMYAEPSGTSETH